jgi:cytochrome P450
VRFDRRQLLVPVDDSSFSLPGNPIVADQRLFPPTWTMGRKALDDFHLGPFFLPAGTTVLMSQWVMHRDARYFPDPLRFEPERFAPESKREHLRFSYFPFGAGLRQCIGESFARMEGVLSLATLAQGWKLRLVPGHQVEPTPLITLRPKYGIRMCLERRNVRLLRADIA